VRDTGHAAHTQGKLKKQTDILVKMQGSETPDVTVVVRIRPLSAVEQLACNDQKDWRAIMQSGTALALRNSVLCDCANRIGKDTNYVPSKIFKFDTVMGESCNTMEVFDKTGALAVAEVVRGVSAAIFAYGSTGSGKTYSLLGEIPAGNTEIVNSTAQGIASKTFQALLQKLRERAEVENGGRNGLFSYTIEVSAVQIYLNQVYDLLSLNHQAEVLLIKARTMHTTTSHVGGQICELKPKETCVLCADDQGFEDLLQRIVAKRVHSDTKKNAQSSRSHLILTLAVKRNAKDLHSKNVGDSSSCSREYLSKLTLIDLAGNERDAVRKEKTQTVQGIDVNLSLSALGTCLRERVRQSMCERKQEDAKSHPNISGEKTIPGAGLFRNSSLTRLLREPLMYAKIFFLACCSPVASSASMTEQTLRYANKVKCIKTSAEDNAMLLEPGDSFPIEFLPHASLVTHGRIPRSHENVTVHLYELRASVFRIMISHRWLSKEHPDNSENAKHALICVLIERLCAGGWIKNFDGLSIVNWLDFCEYVPS
jgi:hypothetical protein